MGKITRDECNEIAYGYFDPSRTPKELTYDEAAYRLAACLYDRNEKDGGKTREKFKASLSPHHFELYVLSLEKLADCEHDSKVLFHG